MERNPKPGVMRLISSARLAPIIALIMGMYMEGGAERLSAAPEKNATDDEPYVQVTAVTIEPSTIHDDPQEREARPRDYNRPDHASGRSATGLDGEGGHRQLFCRSNGEHGELRRTGSDGPTEGKECSCEVCCRG